MFLRVLWGFSGSYFLLTLGFFFQITNVTSCWSSNLNSISPFTNSETTSSALITSIIPLTNLIHWEINWIIYWFFWFGLPVFTTRLYNAILFGMSKLHSIFCHEYWARLKVLIVCMSTRALWAHSSSNAELKVYLVNECHHVNFSFVFFCVLNPTSDTTYQCPAFYLIYTNVLCLDYCTVNNKYFN